MTAFSTRHAITILGAGHIGFAMALLLQQAGDYDLLVADRDPAQLAEVAALGVATRLIGDDTRLQAAIERMGPLLPELFDDDEVDAAAESLGLGPRWRDLQAPWRAQMDALLARATLKAPADMPNAHGGRRGVHSEHLGHLLSELQYLQRAYPGGVW